MGRTEDESQSARRNQRARGEGSIWQEEKTGRWWYAVSVDGKQHKYRAPDKQTAAARLKQLKAELDHGVTPGRQYRLGEDTQRWMDKVAINLKPKTQRFYRQTSEHYVLPYLGERTPMKRVNPEFDFVHIRLHTRVYPSDVQRALWELSRHRPSHLTSKKC
jgi:hypothetical protein